MPFRCCDEGIRLRTDLLRMRRRVGGDEAKAKEEAAGEAPDTEGEKRHPKGTMAPNRKRAETDVRGSAFPYAAVY